MTKKKVLFVATVVKTHIMTFHLPFLKYFHDNGWEVHVAARNDYENKEDCSIPYCDVFHDIAFPRNPINKKLFSSYKKLKEIADKEKFSIVHCNTPVGGAVTRLAFKKSREVNNTKVIYQAHGFHFFKGAPLVNWLIYYPAEYILSFWTDELITINKEDKKRAEKFHAKHVSYVPGVGVDVEKINNIEINKSEKRKELGLSDSDKILLSVGELNDNKNHTVVLDAIFTSSLKDDKNLKYVICGEGPNREKLLEQAKKYNLEDRFFLLGYRNDIYEIMKSSDLFVFPSKREGLPVSVIEAMVCELPVIGSNIRGNTDLIDNNHGGYLWDPTSTVGLSNLILKIINDNNKLEIFGLYNHKTSSKYNVRTINYLMSQIYKKIISPK